MARVTIFCGNLSFNATVDDVRDFFDTHFQVYDVRIALDGSRSRGFGFIEIDARDKDAALKLHNVQFLGRPLTIRVAESGRTGTARRGSW
jgi:RNA recognition motif-containing protein